jgi:hypothetical protein
MNEPNGLLQQENDSPPRPTAGFYLSNLADWFGKQGNTTGGCDEPLGNNSR